MTRRGTDRTGRTAHAVRPVRPSLSRAAIAGVAATVLSGAPSTMHALATGRDPFAATRAAGTLVPGRRDRPGLAPGAVVHVLVSATWTTVLSTVERRRHLGPAGGMLAGAADAVVDLELAGRRYPAIRSLPRWPQWLDHLAFGAVVGAMTGSASPTPGAPARRQNRQRVAVRPSGP